jgi:hypothetical protein
VYDKDNKNKHFIYITDLVRGTTTQNVCDAVALSMTAHPNDKEIQLGACHILSIIGTGFHKQNGKTYEPRHDKTNTMCLRPA